MITEYNMGSIYKIQFPNGKHYIGLTTTSLEHRVKQHRQCAKDGDTKCLYNALRKYDMIDTLELIEIDTADTKEELCEKEIRYIREYNSYYMNGNGYNMTYGGEGTNGYIYTEEDKQRMSERGKTRFENLQERTKQSERIKKYYETNHEAGKEHGERMKQYYQDNPEARQQMSERKKQYYQDNPAARQHASERHTQYWINPEARQHASELKKEYFKEHPEARKEHSERLKKYFQEHPEELQKMSERTKKYYETNPEAKEQISKSTKKYYEDNPDAINRMSEISKKQWANPEARRQMSEIKKKFFENNPEAIKQRLDSMGQNKPFDVFQMDGTFIKTFTYQFEAHEYLQKEYQIASKISIGAVLSGKRNNSAGFVFKYK